MTDKLPLFLENASFAYGEGKPVLSKVNLSVSQGDMVVVVGPHREGARRVLSPLWKT